MSRPENSRFLTIDELLDLKTVSDAQISPAGDRIAFVIVDGFKPHDGPAESRLWMADTAGSRAQPFSAGPWADSQPRWRPDGRQLAFISDRSEKGKTQLYVIDLEGGEARQLVSTPTEVSQPAWSADGRWIAFLATDPESDQEKQRKHKKDDRAVADESTKFDRLYVADVAAGTTKQITSNDVQVWEFDWSPDGSRFAVLTAPRPTDDGWFEAELAVVSSSGGAAQRLLRIGKQLALPRWSPDGARIAFISGTWSDPGSVGGELFVCDVQKRAARSLTERLQLSVSWFESRPDGSGVLFLAYEEGKLSLNEIGWDGQSRNCFWKEPLTCAERMQPRISTDRAARTIAVAREDPLHPRDVWTYSEQKGWRQITRLNSRFATFQLGSTEAVSWSSSDGRAVGGLLVRPAEPDAKHPYPLVVQVHGGPSNIWPYRLCASWHDWAQLLAASGYAVFLPNYRGSFGWGTEFAEANLGDMGGGDWQDIISGVDHLVREGIADGNRLGIGGWSYGGFMAAWAVTQTDRFRAAIMGAGISNWLSFHGTSEIPTWDTLYWHESSPPSQGGARGGPFQDQGKYLTFSPISHVRRAKTPTLILHGRDDTCVPVGQAQEFYRALCDLNVPTELVVYPRQGHPILEKNHQRDLLTRVVGWFDRWLA